MAVVIGSPFLTAAGARVVVRVTAASDPCWAPQLRCGTDTRANSWPMRARVETSGSRDRDAKRRDEPAAVACGEVDPSSHRFDDLLHDPQAEAGGAALAA